MFILSERVAYVEATRLTDGFDDREPQSARLATSMDTLIEAVEEAMWVYLSLDARVGYAQCPFLNIYIDGALRMVVQIGIAQ